MWTTEESPYNVIDVNEWAQLEDLPLEHIEEHYESDPTPMGMDGARATLCPWIT